jgi:outer membrane protein assembly factor BamB
MGPPRRVLAVIFLLGVFRCAASFAIQAATQITPTGGGGAPRIDWLTDGGDAARTGWVPGEQRLTRDTVPKLKLRWKISTGNAPRGLHALMPALIIGELQTPAGLIEVGIVSGVSDTLYAFDVDAGKLIWQRHWDDPQSTGGGATESASITDPRHNSFLQPGGSTSVPAIGPADADGRRPLYFVTGDGVLHAVNAADGHDLQPAFPFHAGKNWALNLTGDVLWMATTYAGASVVATRLSDPQHAVLSYDAGSGGVWGRRGVAVDSTGAAWMTTGNGPFDPAIGQYADSVISVRISGNALALADYYTPRNWNWLRRRQLDPDDTPVLFTYHGRELLVSAGEECRMVLLDARSPGGTDHQTPLARTAPFCNEEVDFQNGGSWGALSTWEDGSGTRWVLAPFRGPVSSGFKFPTVNRPAARAGGVAAFTVDEKAGALSLSPVWVSRDMDRGEPVVIANGVVFGYGSGEETQQVWPGVGLLFDASSRASKGTHATIYALDAATGRELWSSGDSITSWNHFSGITAVNGRVYLGTYDGTIWCFGV